MLVSGFIVFLGGLSWEGFGAFLAVILVVELWRFLTSQGEDGLTFYVLWVLPLCQRFILHRLPIGVDTVLTWVNILLILVFVHL